MVPKCFLLFLFYFFFILDLLLTNAMEVIAKDPSSLSIKCERNINAIVDIKHLNLFIYFYIYITFRRESLINLKRMSLD